MTDNTESIPQILQQSFVEKLENKFVAQDKILNDYKNFKYKHFINLSSKEKH